jgi:hypothetical protein
MRRPKQPKEGFSLTINGDTDTASGQLLVYLFSREDDFKGTEEPDSVAIEYPISNSIGFSFHTTFYANPDGESYRVGGSGVTVKASTDAERQMIKSLVVRQEAALKKHLAALALQAKETEAELALVRHCWEDRLKNLSADELREKCIHLQDEVWKSKRNQVILRHALNHVAEIGDDKLDYLDKLLGKLGSANADYLTWAFENMPSGDISDGLYKLRHIQDVLKCLRFDQSEATTKRDIIAARTLESIPPLKGQRPQDEQEDERYNQTTLTRAELWGLVQHIAARQR